MKEDMNTVRKSIKPRTSQIKIWNKIIAVTRTAWVEKATSFAATGIICNNQNNNKQVKKWLINNFP